MKVDKKDLYHGAALTQITEHASFKALNKADAKYGHYLVNTDRRLLTKYSEKDSSPWQFGFQIDDLNTLKSDNASGFKTFVILVCGSKTVCLLTEDEFTQLIDTSAQSQQWIKIDIPKSSMRLSGSKGKLSHAIKHNGFPARVFE